MGDPNRPKYQLIGVDEPNISKGKIAFKSPSARILGYKKVVEQTILNLPPEERVFEMVDIVY